MDIHALPTIFPAEANAGEQPDPVGSNSAATVPTAKQVFDEYAPRIYHLARRMLGNEADAEDITQEVFHARSMRSLINSASRRTRASDEYGVSQKLRQPERRQQLAEFASYE